MKKRGLSRTVFWVVGILLVSALMSAHYFGFTTAVFVEMARDGSTAIARYRHPDWSDRAELLSKLWETVCMGLWGTVITVLLSVPFSLWSTRQIAPNAVVYRMSREVLNFCRAIPDVLFALILAQLVGLGPFAGVLALGIHGFGFLGKVISDSMERLPDGIYTGLESCGSTKFQTARFGAWPSVNREISGYALYMVDRHIRVATTLGVVGAGGIGVDLLSTLRTFQFEKASAIIILIVGLIVAVDMAANGLRKLVA